MLLRLFAVLIGLAAVVLTYIVAHTGPDPRVGNAVWLVPLSLGFMAYMIWKNTEE
ncbi:hypothetical protein GO986_08670 [Deinococcus sp. HMF7620]|uniref:Uncharacterized protein n=1 Tax=Deinococcus arboris TaxID=2682977 RepID=A0A7C9HZA7_9DEIO|nr:hypothetical protein [Deinococcus arboris]MVN86835.1 hypothetical protein [Deinococcus arboris]